MQQLRRFSGFPVPKAMQRLRILRKAKFNLIAAFACRRDDSK
jgi:hypothetical protein